MRPLGLNVFRRRGIVLSLIVASGVAVLLFGQGLGTWYVKMRISVASSPEGELEAFRLANISPSRHLAHAYRVEAYDATGMEVKPTVTGDYRSVASVRLTWHNGQTVNRNLLNPQSLSYIYGE